MSASRTTLSHVCLVLVRSGRGNIRYYAIFARRVLDVPPEHLKYLDEASFEPNGFPEPPVPSQLLPPPPEFRWLQASPSKCSNSCCCVMRCVQCCVVAAASARAVGQ